MKVARGEDRAGRDLSDGDGVEKLRLGEPVPALDEIRAQKGEQHVAAAEEHRADLGKEPEQRTEAEGSCGRRRSRSAGKRRAAMNGRIASRRRRLAAGEPREARRMSPPLPKSTTSSLTPADAQSDRRLRREPPATTSSPRCGRDSTAPARPRR